MDLKVSDVTKLTWQLNVALIGAIFSAISLIYNESFIYYGFVTFLFGAISHFFNTWFGFVYSDDEQKEDRAKFYHVQSVLVFVWIVMLLIIFFEFLFKSDYVN